MEMLVEVNGKLLVNSSIYEFIGYRVDGVC